MSSFVFGRFALDLQLLWQRFALAFTVFEYRAAPPLDTFGPRPGPLPVPDAPAAEVEAPAARDGRHAVADDAGNPAEQQLVVHAEGGGEGEEEQAGWEGGGDEEDVQGEGGEGGPAGYILALDNATGTSFWVNDGAYIEGNLNFRRHFFVLRNVSNGTFYLGKGPGTDPLEPSGNSIYYEPHDISMGSLVLEIPLEFRDIWERQVMEIGSHAKQLRPQPTGRRTWLQAALNDIIMPFRSHRLANLCAAFCATHQYKGRRAPKWLLPAEREVVEAELAAQPDAEDSDAEAV